MSDAILEAANRLMHNDYPDNLTQEQRVMAIDRDANLVAGAYVLLVETQGDVPAVRQALDDSMHLFDEWVKAGVVTGYQAERAAGRILQARQALAKGEKA